MPFLESTSAGWFRRNFGWSTERRTWLERLGMFSLLVGALALYLASASLSRPLLVVGVALWLALLAVVVRQGWGRLFGPVFFFDLIRQMRRPRYFWSRFAYAVFLAVLFAWMYLTWFGETARQYGDNIPIREMAQFASTIFSVFMVIQFFMIAFMTPAYVAGAIAEEKERKTLEFLLATDLENREIVFGKFASRVGTLLLFLLTGLPILSMIQFFGGVDPDLVIAGFVASIITLLSISAVSMYASVVSKKARDAIALTYLVIVAYTILSLVAFALREFPWSVQPIDLHFWSFTVMDAVQAFASGNTFFAVGEVLGGTVMGGRSSDLILAVMRDYLIFHGVVIGLCLLFGVTRMRPIALRQSYGNVGRSKAEKREAKSRPRVGDDAMLWKEVFVESGAKMSTIGKIMLYLIVGVSFVTLIPMMWDLFGFATVYIVVGVGTIPLYFVFRDILGSSTLSVVVAVGTMVGFTMFSMESSTGYETNQFWSKSAWEQFGERVNAWLRTIGTLLSCLIFLSIAIRAAGSVSGERDKQTFDSLMTTPLSSGQILWGKWWGCILGARRGWLWLGLVWAVGLMSGGLHPGALPLLVGATFVYAGALAWLGLWYSVVSKTTTKATMNTIWSAMFLGGGYFIVFGLCCVMPMTMGGARGGDGLDTLLEFLTGFCPPAVIGILPFREFSDRELSPFDRDRPFLVFVVIGLTAWGFFAGFLAMATQQRFRELYNRSVKYAGRKSAPRRSAYDDSGDHDDDDDDGGSRVQSRLPNPRDW